MIRLFVALFLASALFAQTPPSAQRQVITVGGVERSYLLYVPSGEKAKKPLPLVMVFHGYTDSAEFMERQSHFDRVADRYRFVVVYGEGIEGSWLVPGFTPKKRESAAPNEDLAYVKAIVDQLVGAKQVDPSAVYSTGYSNGGFFSIFLAQALNDRIAAIAPVSGGLFESFQAGYRPARPVPALLIHGTEDKLVPYEGRPGGLIPAEACARFLAKVNGAASEPTRTALPDRDPNDGTTATLIEYAGQAPVQLIRIEGGGHEWPDFLPHPQDREWLGHMSRDFDASELIWRFLSRFRR